MSADKFCPHCGDEVLRCRACGEVIKKNLGWHIWMDYDHTGPAAGRYHGQCLETAKAEARGAARVAEGETA